MAVAVSFRLGDVNILGPIAKIFIYYEEKFVTCEFICVLSFSVEPFQY